MRTSTPGRTCVFDTALGVEFGVALGVDADFVVLAFEVAK